MTQRGIARGLKVGQWGRISAGSAQYDACQFGDVFVSRATVVSVSSVCVCVVCVLMPRMV